MRSLLNTVAVIKSSYSVCVQLHSFAFCCVYIEEKCLLLRWTNVCFAFHCISVLYIYPVCIFLSVSQNLYAGGDEKQEINLVWPYTWTHMHIFSPTIHEKVPGNAARSHSRVALNPVKQHTFPCKGAEAFLFGVPFNLKLQRGGTCRNSKKGRLVICPIQSKQSALNWQPFTC